MAETLMEGEKKLRPFEPGEFVQNPDGSVSTERSVTLQMPDGSWVNVPSLWMTPKGPVDFGEDEAAIFDAAQWYEKRAKKAFPRFPSLDEAVRAAEERSHGGGAFQGGMAR